MPKKLGQKQNKICVKPSVFLTKAQHAYYMALDNKSAFVASAIDYVMQLENVNNCNK
jgi:hypothetical protein